MSTRLGVALMGVALLLYIVLVGQRAVVLLTTGEPIAVAMGVALVVLPLVAIWALGRELWFGRDAERLGRKLEQEDALPVEEVATRPSGRVDRSDAEALFPRYRAEVEAAPEDWRAWYRLGLAYDAAGDRRRAREAVREAIAREKRSRAV